MFSYVHSAGLEFRLIAAFSAGRPKESQPMGCSTSYPLWNQCLAMTSPMANASACPMCRSPDGYGNMSSAYRRSASGPRWPARNGSSFSHSGSHRSWMARQS